MSESGPDAAARLFNALITPFGEHSFDIDYDRYEAFIEYFLEEPDFVDHGGLIVNPEAGEVFYQTDDEYERSTEFALDVIDGAVPTYVGVVGLRRETLEARAAFVDASGADGIFLLPPMGSLEVVTAGGATAYPEVWVDHARAVADQSDLPIIVHPTAPVSAAFGAGLPLEPTLAVLNSVRTIVGWKMTYSLSGYNRVAEAIRDLDRHVDILCASGSYYQEKLAAGYFDGSVSGSFNYAMEPMLEHYLHWRAGDVEAASRVWNGGLRQLQEYVYADNKTKLHPRYKAATWLRGLIAHPYMRPPMPAITREEVETLDRLLRATGLETISEEERDRVLDDPVRVMRSEPATSATEP